MHCEIKCGDEEVIVDERNRTELDTEHIVSSINHYTGTNKLVVVASEVEAMEIVHAFTMPDGPGEAWTKRFRSVSN